MNENPLPSEDQQITLISVRDGNISVTSAKALVVKPAAVALAIDTTLSEPPEWTDNQPITMIYAHEDRVMRLRGVLQEKISRERIVVEPVGEVKEGDRRDFRRANIVARILAEKSDTRSASEARQKQLATAIADDAPEFESKQVNLSGSGLSFRSNRPFVAGDYLDVRLQLTHPSPALVTMVGQVVRLIPSDDGQDPVVAIRFAEISEAHQDVIVYTVFANHFEAEGLVDALDLDQP